VGFFDQLTEGFSQGKRKEQDRKVLKKQLAIRASRQAKRTAQERPNKYAVKAGELYQKVAPGMKKVVNAVVPPKGKRPKRPRKPTSFEMKSFDF
jgi:hypothetical protein